MNAAIPTRAEAQPASTTVQSARERARMRPPQPVPDTERWSIALAASTPVSPAITDRHVFALRPPGSIVAFNLEDGKERWNVELTPEHPLTVDGGRLFVSAGEAIHAIDTDTGMIAWRQPTGTLTAPPLVHQGWVITVTAAEVVARRAADGTVVWRQPNGAQRLQPTIEGDVLYLPLADATVRALDLTTGTEKWEFKGRAPTSEIAVLGDRVYFGSEDKFFYCLDADNGHREWRYPVGAAVIGRPAVDARHVYFTAMDNQVRALDRVDGARNWQEGLPFRPSAGPMLFGTAVVVPGAVTALKTFDAITGKAGKAMTFPAPLASPLTIYPSANGPLAATITGALDVEWKLSLWEPSMAIPLAPLSVLPGKAAPFPPAPTSLPGAP
jgi:outer membrane protein assembly factor BamB